MKLVKVTREEALNIEKDRMPLGRFWLEEDGKFTAMDNTTGDACIREFKTKEECLKWLAL